MKKSTKKRGTNGSLENRGEKRGAETARDHRGKKGTANRLPGGGGWGPSSRKWVHNLKTKKGI